jgi:hypothetical protein
MGDVVSVVASDPTASMRSSSISPRCLLRVRRSDAFCLRMVIPVLVDDDDDDDDDDDEPESKDGDITSERP